MGSLEEGRGKAAVFSDAQKQSKERPEDSRGERAAHLVPGANVIALIKPPAVIFVS